MSLLSNITTTGGEAWPHASIHSYPGLVLTFLLLPNTAASPSISHSVTLDMDRFGHTSTAWGRIRRRHFFVVCVTVCCF
ncbi:hypothetical protein PMIN01_00314 [Paraphaeosphaeria minitans]|uniref:Uncharacterized protein n=1 Tax=Paraphaeosphaeria minitans TaxID=565426 RepID=A0A9P6GTD6_9PLEO|nr:hypothetical protein PMIN01_00314 [Paraphaeosphaeria minitans]